MRRAFTLIELLVSIGVVALVLAILLPTLGAARNAARRAACLSNARQITAAVGAFAASNGGRLPENRTTNPDGTYFTWRQRFLEDGSITPEEAWRCPAHRDPWPRSELGSSVNGSACAGDVRSSYALNGHVLWRATQTDRTAVRSDTVIRRPSHTILIAETNRSLAHLRVSPPIVANYFRDDPGPYAYWHAGRGVYAFQDGHAETARFLDTGSPDCRWHNGPDLSDDPFVPQTRDELTAHDHPDWAFLVPRIYLD